MSEARKARAADYFTPEDARRLKAIDAAHDLRQHAVDDVEEATARLGVAIRNAVVAISRLDEARKAFNAGLGLAHVPVIETELSELQASLAAGLMSTFDLRSILGDTDDAADRGGADSAQDAAVDDEDLPVGVDHDPEALDCLGCRIGEIPEGWSLNLGAPPIGPVAGDLDAPYPYVDLILAGHDREPDLDVDASAVNWEDVTRILFWRACSLPRPAGQDDDSAAGGDAVDRACAVIEAALRSTVPDLGDNSEVIGTLSPAMDKTADPMGGNLADRLARDGDLQETPIRDVLAEEPFRRWPLPHIRAGFALNRTGDLPKGLEPADQIMVQTREDLVAQYMVGSVNWELTGHDDDVVAWASLENWLEQAPPLDPPVTRATSMG